VTKTILTVFFMRHDVVVLTVEHLGHTPNKISMCLTPVTNYW